MKRITATANEHQWPRHEVKSIECRKRDLVIRIADWSRQSAKAGGPAYDVEVYIGGVYDWNESKTHSKYEHGNITAAKKAAIEFAQTQIAKLL